MLVTSAPYYNPSATVSKEYHRLVSVAVLLAAKQVSRSVSVTSALYYYPSARASSSLA